MKEFSIHWHNFIDGKLPLKEQLEQATWCVKALEGLIQLESEGAIKIDTANSDSTPSCIVWDVLDERAYKKAQEEYGLPEGITWENN